MEEDEVARLLMSTDMVELILHLQRRRRRQVRLPQLHVRAAVLVRPSRHAAVRAGRQRQQIERAGEFRGSKMESRCALTRSRRRRTRAGTPRTPPVHGRRRRRRRRSTRPRSANGCPFEHARRRRSGQIKELDQGMEERHGRR